MSQLLADCLDEIFEYLEGDIATLQSCLLVNRLWCEISVRILWRNGSNYGSWNCNTLIACLPNESKEILFENGIVISAPTPRPPMFNYAAFCKVLSINRIYHMIEHLLKQQSNPAQNLDVNIHIISQEIYKLLMNQISSLRKLHIDLMTTTTFISFPGSKNCLKDLTELSCRSKINPEEFFYQLSQICHNIRSIYVVVDYYISNGLMDLIFSQNNLKNLALHQSHDCEVLKDIIPSLTKLSNTLIKLEIYEIYDHIPSPLPSNLHELVLSFYYDVFEASENAFKELQYVTFPQLEILRFRFSYPQIRLLIGFLMNNGENLKKLYVENGEISLDSLNLAISEFCPNLKMLSTSILDYVSLRNIFNRCQYLESINIRDKHMNVKELFETISKYSPKDFYKLKIHYDAQIEFQLLPEILESFYNSWKSRVPQKSFSLIIVDYFGNNRLIENDENMKVIEKYIILGVIKKFKVICYDDDDE